MTPVRQVTTRVARPRGGTEGDAAPGVVTFFVPGKLTNPLNARRGWKAVWAAGKAWRDRTGEYGRAARIQAQMFHPSQPKAVTFTVHAGATWDDDNLAGACKPVRDGLANAGLIHSDAPDSGHTFTYRQVIDRKRRGVMVTVEPTHGG